MSLSMVDEIKKLHMKQCLCVGFFLYL